jgi:hypothetical protein
LSIVSVREAKAALAGEKDFLGKLLAQIQDFDKHIGTPEGYADIRQKTIALYLSGGFPFHNAPESTDAMSADVSMRAETAYQESMTRIRQIRLLTHLLFLVGWALSLVDKLYLGNKEVPVSAPDAT